MGKSSCSQDHTQDTKILFNFNIWVGYGLSLDHTGQTKLYKPQHKYTHCAWAGGTFFPVVLLCQFLILVGNRFWFWWGIGFGFVFYVLMYLECNTVVVLC
jgi:hypothetical protein